MQVFAYRSRECQDADKHAKGELEARQEKLVGIKQEDDQGSRGSAVKYPWFTAKKHTAEENYRHYRGAACGGAQPGYDRVSDNCKDHREDSNTLRCRWR